MLIVKGKAVKGPNTVRSGLVLQLDAGNHRSYPGSGTAWTDMSGLGNTGTLTNGPTFNSANGGGVVLDGTNDYIDLPYQVLSGGGNFTVTAWIKSDVHDGGTVFGNYPAGNLQIFFGRRFIGMWLNNQTTYLGTSPYTETLPEFTTNPTQITAIRRNTSDTEFYINNELKKTGSSSSTIGTTSNFRIGTNTIGNERYDGTVYSIQVYNRALTAAEVLQNYNALRSRFGL
jgi:hypothetical protein